MNFKKLVTIVVYALIGWALCFATMGIGQALFPLQTALLFVGIVIALDFFVVALLLLRSLEMFTSILGTWIPFALIFASTYMTGLYITRNPEHTIAAH